jgi:hypothetical protein
MSREHLHGCIPSRVMSPWLSSSLGGYMNPVRKAIAVAVVLMLIGLAFAIHYVRTHPLVFNESLWGHAHCMPQAALAFRMYASDHAGRFPIHTNGYGDALLLLGDGGPYFFLTGPGYSTRVFEEAWASKSDVDETLCGRVYVQGLSETNDPGVVVLFDKIAAPPDHCHFPRRLWAGFVREVCFVDGSWRAVPLEAWSGFAQEQIDLLVEAGFDREHAESLYNEVR